jgi:hypothetical protein
VRFPGTLDWKRELILGTSITIFRLSCRKDRLKFDWVNSEKIFDLDGPTPRLFKVKMRHGIDKWRIGRDGAVYAQAYEKLKSVLEVPPTADTKASNDIGDFSHELFLVSRKDLEASEAEYDDLPIISIVTPNVQTKLVKKLMDLEREQVLDLYRIAGGASFTRHVAGVFYEAYCLRHMRDDGIHLELLKMVRLNTPASKKRRMSSESAPRLEAQQNAPEPRFHSSHEAIGNAELEEERKKIEHEKETVTIGRDHLKVKYYDKTHGSGKFEENILYIPEAQNEKSLDAFFKHKECLYILQFTIAETHSIKGGLDSFFSGYTGYPGEWKFVFVIDGSQTLKVPVPRGRFQIPLYSAIMRNDNNHQKPVNMWYVRTSPDRISGQTLTGLLLDSALERLTYNYWVGVSDQRD